jgi:hypothetical protein
MGESASQVLSRERRFPPECRGRQLDRKATRNILISRDMSQLGVVVDPVHARKLSAREPGGPVTGLGSWHQGTRCESQGSTTTMNGSGESDRPICTVEAIEQKGVRIPLAENVEGRGLTKRNLFQQNKLWTQDQERSGRDG